MSYTQEWLTLALYASQPTKPDQKKAGDDYESLDLLYKAYRKKTLYRTWEILKVKRPHLVPLVAKPALDPRAKKPELTIEFVKDCLDLQETGDGIMLAEMYGDQLLYDQREKQWYLWNEHYWQRDEINLIRRLLSGQVRAQYYRAAANYAELAAHSSEPDKSRYEQLRAMCLDRAKVVCNRRKKDNVLEESKSDLAIKDNQWDANPWLLGVQNGVIDLQTGQLRAGEPTDYIRTVSPTLWEGLEAQAPRFEQFIQEIFDYDAEMVAFMHRLLGYGITGLATEHILPILYGEGGRNGKDTLLETLAHVLGDGLASLGTSDLLIARKQAGAGGASPHLVDLQGARLKWVSETEQGVNMNAAQVKQLTGGGKIKGRALHSNLIEFDSTYLLMLLTNHKPTIPNGGDPALWKRLLLIPFEIRFVENPQAPNERKIDRYLKDTLKTEASGILAWLVRGCLAYQSEGLTPPETVLLATEEYQKEEDLVTQFISDICVKGSNCRVRAKDLYAAWVDETGSGLSMHKFSKLIQARGFSKRHESYGTVYLGLDLKTE